MKKLKSTLLVLLMAVISLIIYYMVIAITGSNSDSKDDDKNTKPQEEITENQSVNNIDEKVTISLVAVGDNFAHESVIESGKNDDGTYNYDFLFEGIKDEIMSADISAIYQTMIIAGNDKGLSGYPLFNTPEEMMSAIQNTGFDIALMASNHTTDMGVDGIKSCSELWKKYAGVLPVGINESEESSVNIPIFRCNNCRLWWCHIHDTNCGRAVIYMWI